MAPNPLTGVRYWLSSDLEHMFLYLDYKKKYYSFSTGRLEYIEDLEVDKDEILIGPKVIVEWEE